MKTIIINKQMNKGVLEYCTLLALGERSKSSAEIIRELKELKLIIFEGTLFLILSRLKKEGMLAFNWDESKQGPPMKYYHLTEIGKLTLRELDNSWSKINEAIESIHNKCA